MQINVSGHHVDVTDALRSYVEAKLDRLERHSDRINHMDVILSVEKQRQKAESTVRMAGGELFADAESERGAGGSDCHRPCRRCGNAAPCAIQSPGVLSVSELRVPVAAGGRHGQDEQRCTGGDLPDVCVRA